MTVMVAIVDYVCGHCCPSPIAHTDTLLIVHTGTLVWYTCTHWSAFLHCAMVAPPQLHTRSPLVHDPPTQLPKYPYLITICVACFFWSLVSECYKIVRMCYKIYVDILHALSPLVHDPSTQLPKYPYLITIFVACLSQFFTIFSNRTLMCPIINEQLYLKIKDKKCDFDF